jgi:hypothetical protein
MELNPKFEYRNTKQYQMTENQNPKHRWCSNGDSRFGHSDLELPICFGFRASDFVLRIFNIALLQRLFAMQY